MKSGETKDKRRPSCCVVIKQRKCYKHELGCYEPEYALGYIIKPEKHDAYAQRKILDALVQLGFDEMLIKRI